MSKSTKSLTSVSSLRFEALEPRVLFDAAPDVSVVSGDTLIVDEAGVDEEISFNVVIDNVGDQEGFTPYVDFAASPDITIQQVKSNLGVDLTQGNGDPAINPIGKIAADGQLVDIATDTPIDHPMFDPTGTGLTGNDYGGAGSGTPPVLYDVGANPDLVGMYVYNVQAPASSQTPADPGINITVVGTVDPSTVAPELDYTVYAQGGYALGHDALDNPGTVPSPVDPPLFSGALGNETFTVTKLAAEAEFVDLNFDNPVEATNGTFPGIGNYYSGSTMHFSNVANIGGQQVDARLSVTAVTGPYQFIGTIPNHSQSGGSEPNGDIGYLYQSTGAGTGGITYRLEFFEGDGTYSTAYEIPYFSLMGYDVDGESVQSEEMRANEADGLVGYQLGSAPGSVTATREPTSVLFTGPGSNRSETDPSGAFIMYFANTSKVDLEMISTTSGSSPQPNAIFSAIDGDLSLLNGNLSGFNPPVYISPVLNKTLADPSDTDYTIGEPVEYVITIDVPSGRAGDPDAFVLDKIDPGFSFVPGSLSVTLGANVNVGVAGALNEANSAFFEHTDPGLDTLDEQLRFDFDWIEYTGGGNSGTIEIRYQLQVENIAAIQQGSTLNNRAALYFTADDGVTLTDRADQSGESDTIITVVEPQVDATKTITNITNAAPGGTVSYRIELNHPGDSATNPQQDTPAYDVTVIDNLPSGLELQTGTFTALLNGVTDVSSWFTVTSSGLTDNPAASIDLNPGDQLVITYDALITGAVRNNEDIDNEVDVEWTSLDDDDANDGIDAADTGERTGDGDPDNPATGVDDYEGEDNAQFTTSFARNYDFTKTIESTSESHTGTAFGTDPALEDLVIGETVTFRLTASMAAGLTDNVQILDTLSIANGLLDIRNVTVSGGASLAREDGNPWNNNVTISDSLGGGDGYNDSVQIDFGNITNSGSGSAADQQIVVLVEAVVVNDAANQGGDVIQNTGTLNYEDDTTGDGIPDPQTISDTADVEIVEPAVTVTKSIPSPPVNPQTGSTVGYQVVIENTTNFDAFDLTFRDLLPTELDLQTGTFTATRQSDSADVSAFFTPTVDDVTEAVAFDLAAGDRITITYDAVITGLVTDGQDLVNDADVEWTSIDGASADERGGDGDFDNPATGVDDYENGDTATLTTDLSYGFTKAISTTSQAHTGTALGTDPAITDLVIGETVTYLLTAQLGGGTTPSVIIEDDLSLANGILEIRSVTIEGGAAVSLQSGTPFNLVTPTFTDSNGDTYDDEIRIDFGAVDVDPALGGAAADQQIRVFVEAVVVNVIENQDGDVINNVGRLITLQDTDGDGNADDTVTITDNVDVEIVEPAVSVTKTAPSTPANPQAGDTIGYQVVIENTSGLDAFDLTFRDQLPSLIQLQTGTFTATRQSDSADVSAFFTPTASVVNHAAPFDLAAGDRITITYDAVIQDSIVDGQDIINEADVEWTSIDGANADERTGDGDFDNPAGPANPNDYENEDTVTVRADLTPFYGFTKTVETTSAAHTSAANGTDPAIEDLTIGETVTYRLTGTLAKGTTDLVQMIDTLAITEGLLDIQSVTVTAGSALSRADAQPWDANVTITDALGGGDGYNDTVQIDFGTVVNDATGTGADEQIVVLIEALVVNVAENQGGDVINNEGQFRFLEDIDGDGTRETRTLLDDVDVEIVEPNVDVTKNITSLPANPNGGDTVTYEIVIRNTSDTDAFEVTFQDALPAALELQTGTFSAIRDSDGFGVGSLFNVTANGATQAGSGFDLAAGDFITITYDATILETVTDGLVLTNEADVEWSSLNGSDPNERTGDGDFDNPATGVDDYENEDTATFTADLSPQYGLTKSVFTSSIPETGTGAGTDPAIEDLSIGETVTYVIIASIAEGTTPQVQISDTLDLANAILDIQAVRVTGGSNLSTSAAATIDAVTPVLIDSNGDTYTDQFTLDFATVVNDASGTNPEDGQIRIEVDAFVVNIVENQDGDVITNTGTLSFLEDTDGDGSADDPRQISDTVDVEIIEPVVEVTKTIPSGTTTADAGDVIDYQIVIENTSSLDAFEVTFRDLIPAEMAINTGSFTAQRSDLVNVASFFNVTATGITHAGGGFDLAAGQSITINYNATVLNTVTDGVSLNNEADIEWTSADGVVPGERTGDGDFDNPAGPGDPNNYEDEDTASLTGELTPGYSFTKSVLSTSESHTGTAFGTDPAITDLVVGETVTYRLVAQLGRGTTPSVVIDDILDLTNGILDIRDVRVSAGAAISLQSGNPINTIVPTVTDSNGDTYSDQVNIDFGAVINDPALSGGAADEQIVIEIDAVVVNILANEDGDVINNLGRLTVLEDTDGDGNADDPVVREANVDVEIVEPSVAVNKTITSLPANPDAGDTVSYQIVITNSSDIDAFDLTFSDVLPAELDLQTGTFTAQRSDFVNVASLFTVTADRIDHAGTGFDLAAGQSITITYDATILETVRDGQDLTNLTDIEWTSTDGSSPDERTGDGDPDNPAGPGDPNDNEDESSQTFRADLSPVYDFTKTIESTSAAHTGTADGTDPAITDLVIGETVTYRLTATIGRGTTDGVQILDTLDIANGRLDIQSVTVTAGAALSRSDGNSWDNDVTISDLLGAGDGYNDTVQIDFGTVVNDASGTGADEQIVVLVTALVVNDAENQDGDLVTNTGTLNFLEDIDGDGTQELRTINDTADVEIVEPNVTVAKTIPAGTPTADAGDVIGYQIVITNTSDIDAFDLTFQDAIPAEMEINTGSFAAQRSDLTNVASFFDVTAIGITHAGTGFDLAAGQSITITYNATVLATVTDGQNLVNEADIEWTSIDGTDPNERGGDGDFDNPATGPDDYEAEDTAQISGELSPLYDFTKSVLSTSESHTGTAFGTDPAITDLVIGETVTYRLVAQLGRGTTPSVVIDDILDLTNGILDIRDVRISAGAAISLQSGNPINTIVPTVTDSNGDTYSDQVNIDFGAVINDPALSGGAADEQIVIEIDAVVVNVAENQDGDVINNLGRLTVLEDTDGDGNADDTVIREDNVDVEVVEPSVTVAKAVTSVPANPDAGDTISYEVVITNTSDIDAFDVTFSDILPAELDLDTGSFTAQRSDFTNVASLFTVTADSITHAGTGFTLAAGQSITIAYDATILETVRDGQNLTNEADVEWTSIDGPNADERGGDGDPDNPATGVNDYEGEDSGTVQANLSPLYAFTKTVETTSEAHTGIAAGTDPAITDLVIGETVTYRLTATIGRGTTDNVQIFDTLDIANGRLDIRNVTVSAGSALSRQDGNPWDNDVTISDALGAGDGYNDSVQIDFGTVINDASGTGADEQIVVLIEAVVVNDAENQGGDVVNNLGELRFLEDIDQDGTQETQSITDNVDVEILEPNVTVDKSITSLPANPDAGDTVSYQIVIDNSSGVDAFDLTFQDVLPPELDLQTGTFTAQRSDLVNVASFFTVTSDRVDHAGTGFDLADGQSITITYDATILATVRDGQDLTNPVDVEWTSTDGVDPDERTGDGDPDNPATDENNYENEDEETFRADLDPVYAFAKTIESTSSTHTGTANGTDPALTDLVIGETVTYRLTATIGRGTTDQVEIRDVLDIANGRLDIRNVTVSAGAALSRSDALAWDANVTVSDSLGADGYNDTVSVVFNTVVNDPALFTAAEDEQIVVLVEAVVVNDLENQDGDVVTNTGELRFLQDIDGDGTQEQQSISDTEDVEIVEPEITVTKTATSVPADPNAGDTVSYEVIIENTGDIDAFELSFRDLLPAEMDLQTGTFTAIRQSDGLPVTPFFTVTTDSITNASNFDLATGDRITITYDAVILPTVTDGLNLINEANVEWTSLDGASADERSGDGDFDNPADPTNPDDYENGDNETVIANLSPQYAFTKVIDSTSESHTGAALGTDPAIEDLVIGETVTYVLTATMGEGTTPQVLINDTLALANGILDIRDVRISAGSNLTTSAAASFDAVIPTLTDSNGDTYIDQVDLDFGTVVNDATGTDPKDAQIRIEIDAVVVNVIENQDGDIVNNAGTLSFLEDLDDDGSADDLRQITDNVDVEIVEPTVTVAKSIPSGTTEADAGDVIDYRIVITNPGDIDAFDVTFQDLLPAEMDVNTGSFTAIRNSDGGDVSAFFTVTADRIDQAGTGFTLVAGDFITIDYTATVLATVTDGLDLTNEADIEWTSTDGVNADERGGDGDPDNPADPTDPNNYEDESNATITGELSPLYDFTKSVFSTSESHTGTAFGTDPAITDLVIGETVTYELVAQLGRGTTPSVIIEDILALTNGILDIRDVRIEAGAAVSLQSGAPFTSITPTITDSNGDLFNDQVNIDFGAVVNDPALSGGTADEQIRVYIDAVVVNVLANQDGDIVNNLGRLTVLEDTDGDGNADDAVVREDNVDVEIVEPTVSVAKSITAQPLNPDGADTVSYEVVITNTGDIDAFDLTFLDNLPDKVELDTGSFTATRDSDGADVSAFFTLAANQVSEAPAGFDLAAGDFITLTYDVTILETIKDGDRQTNLVDIEWTSTDGVNTDERGGDGDPDNPADPTDPNHYEDEDQTTFIANLVGYDFEKTVYSTSQSHTGDAEYDPTITDLTIGETVTYALTATFPEGTTPSVSIIDILDTAEGILDIESVSISAGANLSSDQGPINGLTPLLEDTNFDGFIDKMTLVFGEITNNASNSADPAADQLVVYVTARVVNVVENRDGDLICNSGTLSYQEDINDDGVINGEDPATTIEECEDVELVEPDLTIDKSVNNDKPKLAETLTYTLTITNDNGSSTADGFDLEVLDRLPIGLTVDPSSITLTHVGAPVNPTSIVSNTSDAQNLRLELDRLDLGETIIITYEATVTSDISYYMAVLPNEADLEWTSTPGDTTEERGGDGDPDTDADPTLTPDFYDDNDNESVEVHQPDLKIVKSDGGAQIYPGQPVTYTMAITNQGRATALEVTVTDNISRYLAEGFQFVSASDGGRLNGAGVVTWNLPDLAVDESITVRLTLRAPGVVPAGVEEIHNVAVADHLDIEPSPDDNRDREDTPITAVPDLIVSKDDGLTYADVGDQVTYRITFDNVGNQVASGVVIRDTLPPGVKFISASDGGRLSGNTVVWELGELRPGDGDTFTVTVEILTAGRKENIVTIEDDGRGGPDPTPNNNRDTDVTIGEKTLQFDLNQNFLFSNGNQSIPGGSLRGYLVGRYPEFDFLQDSRIPVVLGTHMNSGLAQPGSTITLEVYNGRGEMIAEQTVIADTGGNWLATFVTDQIDQQPARIVMKQTWSTPNVGDDTGYNFRTYFAPTFSTASYYTEELSIWNVTGKRAATEVLDLYEASKCVLYLDWNGTTYEFNSRGGLQSSSGN
ncbi:MAG: isopeptide-forming domain-containing fimbrial protein [Verrucomicrobiae bacterium]|nr:isopeptide-forming domain-containing fimbrial protein [Verrucomicrobiae bacterium]